MSMTVQELRDHVRTWLDADEEELPNALLDVFRVEAERRFQQASQAWSFYETGTSFATIGGTGSYTWSSINSTLAEPIAIEGDRWILQPRPHEEMTAAFAATDTRGEPTWWSSWGGSLYLWPIPDIVYTMSVRYMRKPIVTVSGGDIPDLPDEFHPLIANWMVARAYQQQDDEIMARELVASVEQQFALLRRRYEAPYRVRAVLNGKRGSYQLPPRLLYDFE